MFALDDNVRAPRLIVGRPDLRFRSVGSRRLTIECAGHTYAVQQHLDFPPAAGTTAATGSFSVVLHRSFVDAVLRAIEAEGGDDQVFAQLLADFDHLAMADENFFQTSLLTSRFCNRMVPVTAKALPPEPPRARSRRTRSCRAMVRTNEKLQDGTPKLNLERQ